MLSLQFCGRSHHRAAATAISFANPYKTYEISTFLAPKSSFCYIIISYHIISSYHHHHIIPYHHITSYHHHHIIIISSLYHHIIIINAIYAKLVNEKCIWKSVPTNELHNFSLKQIYITTSPLSE